MSRSLCDVASHDLLVFILQKQDIVTICSMSRVSAHFALAARQALGLIQSVSIQGSDPARKLAIVRTVSRYCSNLRQISAHFVDDLPTGEIARVFTECRKLRSFRRVPPGVLKSIRIAPSRSSISYSSASRCLNTQNTSGPPYTFAEPQSGDSNEFFGGAGGHIGGSTSGSEADVEMRSTSSSVTCASGASSAFSSVGAAPAAPMEVPRSMELLTVDIECNQDLRAIHDKFADLKTIQLFNSIHAPLANASITPILLKHRHLSFLSLYGFEITDEVFQAISGLPSLQKLSLVDADLDNEDCAKIAAAVSHVNLELLSVSENREITMEGIMQLAPLASIGALNIRGTSVGFGVLDALAENPLLFPKLVVLMVTQLSLIELTRRAPALKIRYIRA